LSSVQRARCAEWQEETGQVVGLQLHSVPNAPQQCAIQSCPMPPSCAHSGLRCATQSTQPSPWPCRGPAGAGDTAIRQFRDRLGAGAGRQDRACRQTGRQRRLPTCLFAYDRSHASAANCRSLHQAKASLHPPAPALPARSAAPPGRRPSGPSWPSPPADFASKSNVMPDEIETRLLQVGVHLGRLGLHLLQGSD